MTSARKMPTISRGSKAALLAILLTTTLQGCQTTDTGTARDLPAPPANLMRPVRVPILPRDARAALRLTDSALFEANRRLSASAGWYESVKHSYAVGTR